MIILSFQVFQVLNSFHGLGLAPDLLLIILILVLCSIIFLYLLRALD